MPCCLLWISGEANYAGAYDLNYGRNYWGPDAHLLRVFIDLRDKIALGIKI
jgi:hypothetical protein